MTLCRHRFFRKHARHLFLAKKTKIKYGRLREPEKEGLWKIQLSNRCMPVMWGRCACFDCLCSPYCLHRGLRGDIPRANYTKKYPIQENLSCQGGVGKWDPSYNSATSNCRESNTCGHSHNYFCHPPCSNCHSSTCYPPMWTWPPKPDTNTRKSITFEGKNKTFTLCKFQHLKSTTNVVVLDERLTNMEPIVEEQGVYCFGCNKTFPHKILKIPF